MRQHPDQIRRDLLVEHALADAPANLSGHRSLLPWILRRLLLTALAPLVSRGLKLGRKLLADGHQRRADDAGSDAARHHAKRGDLRTHERTPLESRTTTTRLPPGQDLLARSVPLSPLLNPEHLGESLGYGPAKYRAGQGDTRRDRRGRRQPDVPARRPGNQSG